MVRSTIRGIPQSQLLAAFALGAAFLLVVTATVATSGIDSGGGSREPSVRALEDVARDSGLRFGSEQPVLAYAPLVIAPPPPPPPASEASPYAFIWPSDHYLVQGMWAGHPLGVDIGTPGGDPVLAVRDGRVAFAGGDPCCSYGLFVIVEHDEGWSSLYAHFSQIDVKQGDEIKQGQVIGLAGATGTATGTHVHLELRHNGGLVNPLEYLEPHRDWQVTAELLAERNSTPDTATAAPEQEPAGAGVAGGEPRSTEAAPQDEDNSLNASGATMLGAQWLSRQEQSAYIIDVASCVAARSGPNWWVTCDGRLQGCPSGPACGAQLTACVFDQPRVIAAACS